MWMTQQEIEEWCQEVMKIIARRQAEQAAKDKEEREKAEEASKPPRVECPDEVLVDTGVNDPKTKDEEDSMSAVQEVDSPHLSEPVQQEVTPVANVDGRPDGSPDRRKRSMWSKAKNGLVYAVVACLPILGAQVYTPLVSWWNAPPPPPSAQAQTLADSLDKGEGWQRAYDNYLKHGNLIVVWDKDDVLKVCLDDSNSSDQSKDWSKRDRKLVLVKAKERYQILEAARLQAELDKLTQPPAKPKPTKK